MPEFTLNRDYNLRSLHGRVIDFKKGVPTWVPPMCVKEAVAIGAEQVGGKADVLPTEPPPPEELTDEQREAAIFAAFKTMIGRSERSDFTAAGLPHTRVVTQLAGFEVEAKERDALWMKHQAE